ncbi:MAG: hypothetical protein KBB52_07500 [Candidatus Omnitrophica bacterium]|nr:hypothetical protein [Candidatus Omnitrophota bacterium]
MKKIFAILLFFAFAYTPITLCGAVLDSGKVKNKEAAREPVKDEDIVTEPGTLSKEEIAKMKESAAGKKKDLEGTSWNIVITQMSDRSKKDTDVITFSADKVSSRNFSALGYGATSFALRIETDGTTTWETAQYSESGGNLFWTGNITDGVMSGVLTKRDKKNNVTDYSFVSVTK